MSTSSSTTRADDASESIVSARLVNYRSQLTGILNAFAMHGLPVHKVDASGNANRTFALCEQVLANDAGANIVLVGPPGVGKGTVATQLAEFRNATHVSTGDLARASMKQQETAADMEQKEEEGNVSAEFDVDVTMGHMVGFA